MIHIHPFSQLGVGANATLGRFFENARDEGGIDVAISDDRSSTTSTRTSRRARPSARASTTRSSALAYWPDASDAAALPGDHHRRLQRPAPHRRTAAAITIFYGDPDADIPKPPTAANLGRARRRRRRVRRSTTPRRRTPRPRCRARPPPPRRASHHHDRGRRHHHHHRRLTGRRMRAVVLVGRLRHPAAAPHPAHAEADAAGGQPADDRAGGRAPGASTASTAGRAGPGLPARRLPGRLPGRALRRGRPPLRHRAGAARHRRGHPLRRPRRRASPSASWCSTATSSPTSTSARCWRCHERTGAEGTIALHRVEDPSAFGVVPTDDDGRVTAFIEKPPRDEAPTDLINAGTYVLEPSVLDRIAPDVPVNVERVTFPAMVADGSLFAFDGDTYWLDAGTPATYLAANLDLHRRPARRRRAGRAPGRRGGRRRGRRGGRRRASRWATAPSCRARWCCPGR